MNDEFTLTKVGVLKYCRISSISKLKKSLSDFDIECSYETSKQIIDNILINNIADIKFSFQMKYCIEQIFIDCEFEKINDLDIINIPLYMPFC